MVLRAGCYHQKNYGTESLDYQAEGVTISMNLSVSVCTPILLQTASTTTMNPDDALICMQHCISHQRLRRDYNFPLKGRRRLCLRTLDQTRNFTGV